MNLVNRAQLFTLLARYHEAGLTLDAALREWGKQWPLAKKPASRAASLLRGGMPLDKAGALTGLLRPWEARLLSIGVQHGRLDRTLSELTRYYQNSARYWRELGSNLALPATVLLLGWLVLPLPRIISGESSVLPYAAANGVLLILVWLAWRSMSRNDGYLPVLDRFLDHAPLGNPLWTWHRSRFLNALALLIEAGVPAQEALQESVKSCRSPRLRAAWQGAVKSLQGGSTVAASLRQRAVLDETGYPLVDSGEASGRLVDTLKYERDRLDQELGEFLDMLADWLPRIIYLLVILLLFARFV
jgi:type II secretory pathway component PulF